MRANRSKDTRPEMAVRSILWNAGYRYRLHRRDLPGKPDVVFPGRRKVIFVHGCFWHQHQGCRRASKPKSRMDYWRPKLERNVSRDASVRDALSANGWAFLIVWECELKALDALTSKLRTFLEDGEGTASS